MHTILHTASSTRFTDLPVLTLAEPSAVLQTDSSNFSFSHYWAKQLGSLADVCFYFPNSQKAVQILSVSSKAHNAAGLALQRLHYSTCLRPWRQKAIMQNVDFIMPVCYVFLDVCIVLYKPWKHINQLSKDLTSNGFISLVIQGDVQLSGLHGQTKCGTRFCSHTFEPPTN